MLLQLLTPALLSLLPQAGGGGSFGGGGGGGSGGDGAGVILYLLIRLALEYPVIGVPLLIGALILGSVGTQRGWWKHQERVIGRTRPLRHARISAVLADSVRKSDPEFSEARFLARVRQAFEKAQASWCAQDLEPLRPFVSDGVFERFSLQVQEQQVDGWRQGMNDLRLQTLELVQVASDQHFDTITVRIPFRADIHRLSLETRKRISGSDLPRGHFAECWTFLRRRGAHTLTGAGLMEGQCPNCGAPLTMNQSARCSSCECLARSGQFDWVLTEITQASEWRPDNTLCTPGLAPYTELDPGFSVPQLEDRTSVAFWRRCAADRLGETGPLTRLADAEFAEQYAARLAPSDQGLRAYTAECAVGSVRTLGLLVGTTRDRAVVELVWDGVSATVKGTGPRKLGRERYLRRSLFVLARRTGQQTSVDDAFTTTHCRACGAHDSGGTEPDCPYCGTPRTGDASTWLLTEILNSGSDAARTLLAELETTRHAETMPAAATHESVEGLLAWAVDLAREDGQILPAERRALHDLAEREDVTRERMDALIDAPQAAAPEPRDHAEALAWLAALTELALADGSVSRGERSFLNHTARHLGLDRRARARALRDARSKLFRESRAARV